jgi:hypothetical protein
LSRNIQCGQIKYINDFKQEKNMMDKKLIEKAKPRGRPFQKGGKNASSPVSLNSEKADYIDIGEKFMNAVNIQILKGEKKIPSDRLPKNKEEYGVLALKQNIKTCSNEKDSYINAAEKFINDLHNQILTESIEIEEKEINKEKTKDLEMIESIDFKNGENTLSIRFSKRHNRMFRIQVFLNNENQIRPVTYTGASTGYAFWNLLKGALKK